jgi:hypothetical protein
MADRPDQHRLGRTPAHRQPSLEQHVRPACPGGLRSFGPSSGFSNCFFQLHKVVGRKQDDHGHARSITSSITPPTYGLLPFAWSRACCHSYGARSSARRSRIRLSQPRQQTACAEIPIASDARPRHTSRGFLLGGLRAPYSRVRRAAIMGPTSANLHNSGHPRKVGF